MITLNIEDIKIGFEFSHQRGRWVITTDGNNGWFGITHMITKAFTSESLENIILILKEENDIIVNTL